MQNGTFHAFQDEPYTPGVILVRVRRNWSWRQRATARRLLLGTPPLPLPPQVTGGAGFIGSHVVARLVEQYNYKARVQSVARVQRAASMVWGVGRGWR